MKNRSQPGWIGPGRVIFTEVYHIKIKMILDDTLFGFWSQASFFDAVCTLFDR